MEAKAIKKQSQKNINKNDRNKVTQGDLGTAGWTPAVP